MKSKKSPRADLQTKRFLFMQIGAVVALAAALALFNTGTAEKPGSGFRAMKGTTIIEPDMVYVPVNDTRAAGSAGIAKVITTVDILNIVDGLAPSKVVLGEMPGIDDIFDSPLPAPVRFEKPEADTIFIIAQQMPRFMGGDIENFRRWVLSNIDYPELALRHGISGRVRLEFIVEKDGSVSNVRAVESPDGLLSRAAAQAVEGSPRWEPGRQRDKPVRVRFNMPVDFRID